MNASNESLWSHSTAAFDADFRQLKRSESNESLISKHDDEEATDHRGDMEVDFDYQVKCELSLNVENGNAAEEQPSTSHMANDDEGVLHHLPFKRSESNESLIYVPPSEAESLPNQNRADSTTRNMTEVKPIVLLKEIAHRTETLANHAEAPAVQSNIRRYYDAYATDVEALPADIQMKCLRELKLANTNLINKYQEMAEEQK